MSKSVNTNGSHPKRKLPKTAWKKGQSSPNPAGAPKRGESWAELIKQIGDKTPAEASQLSLELSKRLLEIGEGVTLKQAVVLRVYAALLFEPDARMLNAIMDRSEGKVSQPLEVYDYRKEAKEYGVDLDAMVDDLFSKVVNHDAGEHPA